METETQEPKISHVEEQTHAAISSPKQRQELDNAFSEFFDAKEASQPEAAPTEPIKAEAPVAAEVVPASQPAEVQPAPAPTPYITPELDPYEQQARSHEVIAHISRSPRFKEAVAATDRAYFGVLDEMAEYLDAPAERVKKEFLDPLKSQWRPGQLSATWWDEQMQFLRRDTPTAIRRKIELQIAEVIKTQEQQDKVAMDLSNDYPNEMQRQANARWEQEVGVQVAHLIDNESEFDVLKSLQDDAKAGNTGAQAEVARLDGLFRKHASGMPAGTPSGTMALKTLRWLVKQTTASKPSARQSTPAQTRSTISHGAEPQKATAKDRLRLPGAKLEDAFEQWQPEPNARKGWDYLKQTYR